MSSSSLTLSPPSSPPKMLNSKTRPTLSETRNISSSSRLISAQLSTLTTLLLQKTCKNASTLIGSGKRMLIPSGSTHFKHSTRSSTSMVCGLLRTRPTLMSRVRLITSQSLRQLDTSSQLSVRHSSIPLGSLLSTLARKALTNYPSFLSTKLEDPMMSIVSLLMPPTLTSPSTILVPGRLKRKTSHSTTCTPFTGTV